MADKAPVAPPPAPAPKATQTPPHIVVQSMANGDVFYQQAETDAKNSRKVIDTLLDTPEGSGISVTILTGGRTLQFAVSSKNVEIGDLVKLYNGIKIRKA